jgi:hypothetical protein
MPATLIHTPRLTAYCSSCGEHVEYDPQWEVWVSSDTKAVACIDVEDGEPIYDVHTVEPGEIDASDFDNDVYGDEGGW